MADLVGQQLGNYRLLRVLGEGAYAAVYLGEHLYLERLAAIKVLHMRMASGSHEVFRREARIIAQLQHPHIIAVHDFGIADQIPYLVMEYTQGGTLRSRYPKGTLLPAEHIVSYVKQIASALDYAHEQHVIHRDVKPENVLLNAKGGIVLSDFGIAVVQNTLDTLSGQNRAGTPQYMAPEQIRGRPCAASDQYALGVMVYEWLCGEPPFSGPGMAVLYQHTSVPSPGLRTRLPQLLPAVEDAVLGALAKDPQDRFATVQDFATVLEEAFFRTQLLVLSGFVEQESPDETTHTLGDGITPVPVEQDQSDDATLPPLQAAGWGEGQGLVPGTSTRSVERPLPVSQQLTSTLGAHSFGNDSLARDESPPVGRSRRGGYSAVNQGRQALLWKMRSRWIEGVLSHSLHGAVPLALGLETWPDGVANPWKQMLQQPDIMPRPLPAGTSITQVYDELGGELLILGAPGAGKTTLLLELARDLLERAERDEQHPMPVVFILSSWATKRQSLTDWLIEELNIRYQIPTKLAQALVEADQILPLLDGLDEVAPKERTACIEAINIYRQEHGLLPMVVCSRKADYLAQTVRLQLSSAMMVQPLSQEQVEAYLHSAGPQMKALSVAVHHDPDLQKLSTTPLMLSILTQAYQETPGDQIAPFGTLPTKQEQVLTTYVRRMLARPGPYTPQQTIHWLSWLAKQLMQRSQKELSLEHIQPDWLLDKRIQRLYSLVVTLIVGLIFGSLVELILVLYGYGLGVYLIDGLSLAAANVILFGLIYRLDDLLMGGLLIGLLGDLAVKLITGSKIEIGPTKELSWSWAKMRRGLVTGLVVGGIYGFLASIYYKPINTLTIGLLAWVIYVLASGLIVRKDTDIQPAEMLAWSWVKVRQNLVIGLVYGSIVGLGIRLLSVDPVLCLIVGTLSALSYGLIKGLSSEALPKDVRIKPNQGIWRSVYNGICIALIAGLLAGLITSHIAGPFYGLYFGFYFGLVMGLQHGGSAALKHCVLRLFLWRAKCIPWNYVRFLDYATERDLLLRVGGSYIFFHQLLLEHFATGSIMPERDEVPEHK